MVQTSRLLGLCGIAIVTAQVSEYQVQENPWLYPEYAAQYPQSVAHISTRQDFLDSPEGAAIVAVAVGGALGLGGVTVGLVDASNQRQTLRTDLAQAIEQESTTCANVQAIKDQISNLVDVLFLAIEAFSRRKRSADKLARQAMPADVVQGLNNIKSSLPRVTCR